MGDKVMADGSALQPAAAIAQKNRSRQPNESAEYRKAREALLVEEIELNRHIARVAAQRRALPPGGEVKGDYQFIGEASSVAGANPVDFEMLFARGAAEDGPRTRTPRCQPEITAEAVPPGLPRHHGRRDRALSISPANSGRLRTKAVMTLGSAHTTLPELAVLHLIRGAVSEGSATTKMTRYGSRLTLPLLTNPF